MTKEQQEIIKEFDVYDTWEEKYEYLIDLAQEMPFFEQKLKSEKNIVHGCTSRVWIVFEKKEGKIYFSGDSDSLLVKGILSLFLRVYSDKTGQEILQIEPDFIDQLGLSINLSANRVNGLQAILNKIKTLAKS